MSIQIQTCVEGSEQNLKKYGMSLTEGVCMGRWRPFRFQARSIFLHDEECVVNEVRPTDALYFQCNTKNQTDKAIK